MHSLKKTDRKESTDMMYRDMFNSGELWGKIIE